MDDLDEETKRQISLDKLRRYTYGITDSKKIEKVLSLIESFNLLPDKVDPVRELVRKIKKTLEE